VLRRRWSWVAAGLLLGIAASSALTYATTPQYASSARLYVSSAQTKTSDALLSGQLSQQRIASYADLASGDELAESVIDDLGISMSAGELASKVTTEVVPSTVILQITVLDPEPKRAQALTQAYAEGLSDMIRQLETPPGRTVAPIKATIYDSASTPGGPVSPQPVRNLAIGVILGLLLGVGTALLRDVLDTRVSSPEELSTLTHAPLLGAIAYDSGTKTRPLVTQLESHAPRVESFRVLRTNLQFVDVDTATKVFVVTSAVPEEGKTTTSVNLAITLAQAGYRTVLVEGDLRRPRAGRALDLDQAIGVTTILLGRVGLSDAIQKHPVSDLHLLGSGAIPPNPAELLQSKAMTQLLAELREQYDMVIIDAPPLLPVTDAALLAAQADGALLIVRHGRTSRDQVNQAVQRLEQVDASLVGVVMNMVPNRHRRYGYGYGYGYAPDKPAEVPPVRRSRKHSD
jgi:capsular exopolysaccharide synthesis family protein